MKYKTVIFDFDGTIAQSEIVALEVLNSLAQDFNFTPISSEEIRQLRGKSAKELLVKRLKIPLWHVWKIYRLEERARHEFNSHLDRVEVVSGIKDIIGSLRKGRYRVGVLSSNSEVAVGGILKRAGIDVDFLHTNSRFFGKTHALRSALRTYAIDLQGAVYVGDELRDVEACKKVGLEMIAVAWGFNSMEALANTGTPVVTDPQELLQLLVSHN